MFLALLLLILSRARICITGSCAGVRQQLAIHPSDPILDMYPGHYCWIYWINFDSFDILGQL